MSDVNVPNPSSDEVIVVFSGRGGLPHIDLVTRDPAMAAQAFNSILWRYGRELTEAEALRWRSENAACVDEIHEIDGCLFLSHSDELDVFVERVKLR